MRIQGSPSGQKPKTRRRWFRFSLRTFLVFTVVLSIALGWLGSVLVRVRHQREIVAHIQAHGGHVLFDYELDPTNEHSSSGEPVPPGPAFIRAILGDDAFAYVEYVNEFASPKPDNKIDFMRVAELPRLRHLSATITDRELGQILRRCDLESLTVNGNSLSPHGYALLNNERSLRSLGLFRQETDDASLVAIGRLQQLQSLTLARVHATSEGLSNIGQLQNLKELSVYEVPGFDDNVMREVGKLQQLETLNFARTSVTDKGFRAIANMKELRVISISRASITDEGMVYVSELEHQNHINVAGLSIGDRTFEAASKLKSLEFLNMGSTKLTNDGLRHAGKMKNLRTLGIPYTGVTDEGLGHLVTLQNLDGIRLSSPVTQDGAKKLKRALPECEVVFFDSTGPGIVIAD